MDACTPMVIEPRRAEPGAVRRWSRQAFALIRRGIGFWAGLTLAFCVWMFLGQRMPILDGALALVAFFSSVVIAARLDRPARASISDVLDALGAAAKPILGFSVVIALAGALIWMLFLAKPGVPWWNALYTERNVVEEFSTHWYTALRQLFVYAAYALGLVYFGINIPGLTSFFQFPLTALLDTPWRDSYRLSAAAQVKNLAAMFGLGMLFIVLPAVFVLAVPPLVPLLYCFLGAVAYVAYREIFLGIGDNAVLEAVPARVAPVRVAVR
jgi:hypothetical protein